MQRFREPRRWIGPRPHASYCCTCPVRSREAAARRDAEERLRAAQARLANLRGAQRPRQVEALQAQANGAEAARRLSAAQPERERMLFEANATDPSVTSNAIGALGRIAQTALNPDLRGVLQDLAAAPPPIDPRVHRRYNPESVTAYNIVPGLLGVILTMTMVLMTGLAMTRERERGTFENLLATPALPIEVMTGKIVSYILIGLIQVAIVLVAARYLFEVPMQGSLPLLFGFMFPFCGMPEWAQWIGNVLPLTHFFQLACGILLKGNGIQEMRPQVWPILLLMAVVLAVGLKVYRRTLD
jgi:ABC-2 type transport system permease protein